MKAIMFLDPGSGCPRRGNRTQSTRAGPGYATGSTLFYTISTALDSASTGDLIIVSDAYGGDPDSAYFETFTVKSGVQVIAASGQSPIIDGASLGTSAVRFETGASSTTVLQGFTIRGGTDTVVVVRGSGTIRDCTIGDVTSVLPPYGSAGIHCEGDGSVKHCTISMTKNVNAGIRAVGNVFVGSCTVETNSHNGPSFGVDMDGRDGTWS